MNGEYGMWLKYLSDKIHTFETCETMFISFFKKSFKISFIEVVIIERYYRDGVVTVDVIQVLN